MLTNGIPLKMPNVSCISFVTGNIFHVIPIQSVAKLLSLLVPRLHRSARDTDAASGHFFGFHARSFLPER